MVKIESFSFDGAFKTEGSRRKPGWKIEIEAGEKD